MNERNAGSTLVSHNGMLAAETEEPPGTESALAADRFPSRNKSPNGLLHGKNSQHVSPPVASSVTTAGLAAATPEVAMPVPTAGRRHPKWKDIPTEQWEDWRWQRQHAIKTTEQLAELIPYTPEELTALTALEAKYRMAIPPYYFSLIDLDDPLDPIRQQAVPDLREETNLSGEEFEDPLEEDKDSPVPGLTHRYPDRALLVTTPVCTMYCRFCTRKRVTMDREGWDGPSRNDERMIEYVRNTPAIRDVIVSGGDPLTLPVAKLKWFITNLAAIEHLDVIRIGTRVPVTLPQRLFDQDLIDLLASAGKIWIQTHFNHPNEITPETARAVRNLVNAGMPVSNHAVLLKGVNDTVEIMRELMRGLLRIKARPYYLFHCDPVVGAGHFRTSVWKGVEIIEGLRGHISGLGVPTYVVDGLHGAGKIPVMPNYLISASEQAVVLRNYEGLIFRYAPEDKVPDGKKPFESVGVSGVLSGHSKPLIPANNRRMGRRKNETPIVEAAPAAAVLPVVDSPAVIMPTIAATNGAATNGAVSNIAVGNGAAANGHGANGHGANGHNGHAANGHAKNGNGKAKDHADNGHANGIAAASGAKTNGAAKTNGSPKANGLPKANGSSKANGAKANGLSPIAPVPTAPVPAASIPPAESSRITAGKMLRVDVPAALKAELLRKPAAKPVNRISSTDEAGS